MKYYRSRVNLTHPSPESLLSESESKTESLPSESESESKMSSPPALILVLQNTVNLIFTVIHKDRLLKGYSEIIAVTTPSIFIKSEMFAFWEWY